MSAPSKNMLIFKYSKNGLSIGEIAKEYKVSRQRIDQLIVKYGIVRHRYSGSSGHDTQSGKVEQLNRFNSHVLSAKGFGRRKW